MKWSLKEFEPLDDIGFIGIPGHVPSPEDRAFYAKKGEEARQKYYATHSKKHIENMNRKARAILEANERANARAADKVSIDGGKRAVISISLPISAIKFLRSTGRGWQSRASEYLIKGIYRGVFSKEAREQLAAYNLAVRESSPPAWNVEKSKK